MNQYEELSDDKLVLLLKENDEGALSELYLRYWDKLLSVSFNQLKDGIEAEELVQDIFISLWRRRQQLILRHKVSTYLAVAVKYRVIDIMDRRNRERIRQQQGSLLALSYLSPSVEEYVLEKELLARIEASINQLPEKCRIVFRLSRNQGLSNKQISAELSISEGTVEKHLSKAIKHVRGNLTAALPALMALLASTKHS